VSVRSSASFSFDRRYRFKLRRTFEGSGLVGLVNFVMLNPSTADATENDPTVVRCQGFARRWGFRGLTITNLYALRATKPAALWAVGDPIGIPPLGDNDDWLRLAAVECDRLVVAWGGAAERSRAEHVLGILSHVALRRAWARPMCFGVTRSGEPFHPLYQRRDAELVAFPGYRE